MKKQLIVTARVEEDRLFEALQKLTGLTVGDPRVKVMESSMPVTKPATPPPSPPPPSKPVDPIQFADSYRVSISDSDLSEKFMKYAVFIDKDQINNQDIEEFCVLNKASRSSAGWYAGRLMKLGIINRLGYQNRRPYYEVMKKNSDQQKGL